MEKTPELRRILLRFLGNIGLRDQEEIGRSAPGPCTLNLGPRNRCAPKVRAGELFVEHEV